MQFLFSIIFIMCFISSCSTQPPAPIDYNYNKRGTNNKQYNGVNNLDDKIITSPMQSIPQHELGSRFEDTEEDTPTSQPKQDLKTIYHDVLANESLEQIARTYEKTVDEIARLNNISPYANLSEGQVIKVNVSSQFLNKINQANSVPIADTTKLDPTDNEVRKPQMASLGYPSSEEFNPAPTTKSLITPVNGQIVARFGETIDGKVKAGINIEAPEGSDIRAAGEGVVIHTEHNTEFGNLAIIKLNDSNTSVAYAYMKDLKLQKGQNIKKGEVIGHIGMTGKATKPQLYFAVREGKKAVDPEKYINP